MVAVGRACLWERHRNGTAFCHGPEAHLGEQGVEFAGLVYEYVSI